MRWLGVSVVVLAGCWSEQLVDDSFTQSEWDYLQTFRWEQLAPSRCNDCEKLSQLGKLIFFDPRFAGPLEIANDGENGGLGDAGEDGKVSCAVCHDPGHWFADSRSSNAQSLGVAYTRRNTPSLVGVASRTRFGWIGRAPTLERTLDLAVYGPAMRSSAYRIAAALRDLVPARALYDGMFEPKVPQVIPGADEWTLPVVTEIYQRVASALAAYESQLVAGPSPFDRYLAGDRGAIDDAARRGAKLFIGKALCSECHRGPLFSDDEFHVIGISQRGSHAPVVDVGRTEVDGDAYSRGAFRTPSLRQVAETAPYMHAGQLGSLGDVVAHYRRGGDDSGFSGTKDPRIGQLDLDDDDARDLEAFLRTLTGAPVDEQWASPPVTR